MNKKMEKAILLSLKSEQAINILNLNTLLINRQYPKNFTGWVYIYVTKGSKGIYFDYLNKEWFFFGKGNVCNGLIHNGKVVARFWFDAFEEFDSKLDNPKIQMGACVDDKKLIKMFNGKKAYAWNIKKLEIFDNPKELSEFYIYGNFDEETWRTLNYEGFKEWAFIKKAAPNWKRIYFEIK